MNFVRWGILSTAEIATDKVIPAMQKGKFSRVTAIASRSLDKAQRAAKILNIQKAYGKYEDLLADRDIDALYIPLPNHLHVSWASKALHAGKHVLCEKPLGLNAEEAQRLYKTSQAHPNLKIMEAFMYRHHPQWQRTQQMVREGEIGDVEVIHSFFSYHNRRPDDIRNQASMGGGGLLDIGCYCISLSRFIFNAEPVRVLGSVEYDPTFKVDRLAAGILEFNPGKALFSYGTQMAPHQHVSIIGTTGRIEIALPFNPPPDQPTKIKLHKGGESKEITLEPADQYRIQGDLISRSILQDTPVPTPLDDAVANMRVIDAVFQSAEEDRWVSPDSGKLPL